jgi:hypothetical protein
MIVWKIQISPLKNRSSTIYCTTHCKKEKGPGQRKEKNRKFIQKVTSMYVCRINTWKKDQHLFKKYSKTRKQMLFSHHFSIGPTFSLRW